MHYLQLLLVAFTGNYKYQLLKISVNTGIGYMY